MQITPATFGDNLTAWFRILGRRWKPLVMSSLVVYVPLALAVLAIFMSTGAGEALERLTNPDFIENATEDQIIDLLLPFLWTGLVWIVAQTLATVFVYLAGARIVAEDRAGRPSTPRSASRFAFSKLAPGVVAGLIVSVGALGLMGIAAAISWAVIASAGANFFTIFVVAVVVLTTLVIVLWLGLSVVLYAQALALENVGPTGALKRSFKLVQGKWWATLGFLFVTGLIASAAAQVVSVVLSPLFVVGNANTAVAFAYALITLIQGPVAAAVAAAYAIWYIDLRAHRESLTTDDLL